jgi:hypothetical protein
MSKYYEDWIYSKVEKIQSAVFISSVGEYSGTRVLTGWGITKPDGCKKCKPNIANLHKTINTNWLFYMAAS